MASLPRTKPGRKTIGGCGCHSEMTVGASSPAIAAPRGGARRQHVGAKGPKEGVAILPAGAPVGRPRMKGR